MKDSWIATEEMCLSMPSELQALAVQAEALALLHKHAFAKEHAQRMSAFAEQFDELAENVDKILTPPVAPPPDMIITREDLTSLAKDLEALRLHVYGLSNSMTDHGHKQELLSISSGMIDIVEALKDYAAK